MSMFDICTSSVDSDDVGVTFSWYSQDLHFKIKSECMDDNMMSREVLLYRRDGARLIIRCSVMEAILLGLCHSQVNGENSRQSSYAFSQHPPYEKFRGEAPMASGLEAKSYGEYSRRSSYKKETLPYLSYTYVWLTYDNTFICGGEWRSAITWWCTVGGDFFGRGIWDQTPNTRQSSFSQTRAIPRKSPIGGESHRLQSYLSHSEKITNRRRIS